MRKDDISLLEANIVDAHTYVESGLQKTEYTITDIMLTEEDLQQSITDGTRSMTLRRYIFEQIIPYFYNPPRKKIL